MMMQPFFDGVLGGVAALFPVVDPIGAVPIFLMLTAGVSKELRHRYAITIARNVVLLLVGALLKRIIPGRPAASMARRRISTVFRYW